MTATTSAPGSAVSTEKKKAKTAKAPESTGPGYAWTWKAGPVAGPALSAGGALSLAMAGDLAHLCPWWAAGTGVTAAVVAGMRDLSNQVSPGGIAYRVACWAATGAWGTWAMTTSPWSVPVLTGLGAGALLAGLAAPGMAAHERHVLEVRAQEQDRRARIDRAVEWELRLKKVCGVDGAHVEAMGEWESGYGYSVWVKVGGGVTVAQIATRATALASDAGLPRGCTVEVAPGDTQDTVLIRVNTKPLPAEIAYPDDLRGPATITDEIPLGLYRTGAVYGVELIEDPLLVVGRRGSGKTNLLQGLNFGLLRCTDTLVWHIDLNGAGMSRPWMQRWLNGQAGRPVLDWVAATVEEAVLMLETAIKIGHHRKVAHGSLMDQVDDDKIPVGSCLPAIVIVFDEGAEGLALNRGASVLRTKAEEVISQLRAARIQLVMSTLRATADVIPPAVKAQVGGKVFMAPEDLHEVAQLVGWKSGMTVPDVSRPGHALVRASGRAAGAAQAWRVLPSRIREITPVIEALRAGTRLEDSAVKIAGSAYAERWTRYLAWHTAQGGTSKATVPTAPAGAGSTKTLRPLPPPMSPEEALAQAAAATERARKRVAEVQAQREFERLAKEELGDLSDLGEQILAAEDGAPAPAQQAEVPAPAATPAPTAQPPADGPAVMAQILAEHEGGIHRDALLAALLQRGVKTSEASLSRWLTEAKTRGEVHQPQRGWWAPRTPKE